MTYFWLRLQKNTQYSKSASFGLVNMQNNKMVTLARRVLQDLAFHKRLRKTLK